ncbi:MAG: ATP-binding cassette domain-containing protein [bacterium]
MITVKNLTKRFGPTVAVDNISFEVQKGEILGFLGPNGAGKSTTMKILTCYMPPDEGKATLAGLDTFEDSLKIREKIGYLPENTPLYNDMGTVDYLKFIAEVRKIPRSDRSKRLKEVTQLCGLGKEVLIKNIGQLSKGYRQRVGLAQALIHNPDILIFDEPTTGLDPNQIIEIRSMIKEIGKEKTVILCSHILPEVQATCNRIIIIKDGKIVGSGTPEELAAQAQGEEIVYITIHGPEDMIRQKLDSLDYIQEYRMLTSEDGNCSRYEIKSPKGLDIRRSLFQVVADNKWSLSELHRTQITLEDVFKQLTTEEN